MPEELPRGRSGRPLREVVVQAAQEGGRTLIQRFGGPHRVTYRGRGNIVTDTDLLVEERIVSLLLEEFPGFGVLAEESGGEPSPEGYTWVVDPLDGTRNYVSGIPFFSLVIALARGDRVVLGLTYDPVRQELFLGEEGKGATVNGRPLSASQKEDLFQCVIRYDMGYQDDRARHALELMVKLWPGMQTMRVMGSSALGLAYAAAGRIDLYFHHSLAPWDLAAGLVLAREAGAIITDREGRPANLFSRSVILSSPRLHAQFLERARGTAWLEA